MSAHAARAQRRDVAGASEANAVKLFVYGTLRRGQPAHRLLLGAARFVADAWTEPAFTLVDMGGYPGLIAGGETAVRGEIYVIDPSLLGALDEYEDCPHLYARITLLVSGHEVICYALPPERAVGWPSLSCGDWCAVGTPSAR